MADDTVRIPMYAKDRTVRGVLLLDWKDVALSEYRWHIAGNGYPMRNIWLGNRKNAGAYAHRDVMERVIGRPLEKGEVVDHINHDKLDNRRENLRLTTQIGNGQNRDGLDANNTSGHRGVYWHKECRKWAAETHFNGKKVYIGLFPTAEAAGEAAEAKRTELGFLKPTDAV